MKIFGSPKPNLAGGVGIALIVAGLALAIGPSAFIEIRDQYLSRVHQAETEQWLRAHRAGKDRANPGAVVIAPGRDGYLLEVPKIGLRVVVRKLEADVLLGKNTPLLKRYGVGQIPYTSQLHNISPGAEGTAAITGHRTTSGAPFRQIDRLVAGDLIILLGTKSVQLWEVVSSTTVAPTDVGPIRSRPGIRRLALIACDPPFTAHRRLIVYARLVQETERMPARTQGAAGG